MTFHFISKEARALFLSSEHSHFSSRDSDGYAFKLSLLFCHDLIIIMNHAAEPHYQPESTPQKNSFVLQFGRIYCISFNLT